MCKLESIDLYESLEVHEKVSLDPNRTGDRSRLDLSIRDYRRSDMESESRG